MDRIGHRGDWFEVSTVGTIDMEIIPVDYVHNAIRYNIVRGGYPGLVHKDISIPHRDGDVLPSCGCQLHAIFKPRAIDQIFYNNMVLEDIKNLGFVRDIGRDAGEVLKCCSRVWYEEGDIGGIDLVRNCSKVVRNDASCNQASSKEVEFLRCGSNQRV